MIPNKMIAKCYLFSLCLCLIGAAAPRVKTQPAAVGQKRAFSSPKSKARFHNEHWSRRYAEISKSVKTSKRLDIMLVGDSITEGLMWSKSWKNYFKGDLSLINAGISNDKIENILWRLQHENNLTKLHPKVAMVLAGANNLGTQDAATIASGVHSIVQTIREQSPRTHILLLGVFPLKYAKTHPLRKKIDEINQRLAKAAKRESNLTFMNVGTQLLNSKGEVPAEIMPDGIHPNETGRSRWLKAVGPSLKRIARGQTPQSVRLK